jgi:hypothetical protein
MSAQPKPRTDRVSSLDECATERQLAGPRKIPFEADGQRKLSKLIQSFGQPGFQNANGKLSRLNEPFWAQLLGNEEIAVFEPDERQFYWYVPELGLFVPRSEDSIRKDYRIVLTEPLTSGEADGLLYSSFEVPAPCQEL